MRPVAIVGLDIAKTVFQVHGVIAATAEASSAIPGMFACFEHRAAKIFVLIALAVMCTRPKGI